MTNLSTTKAAVVLAGIRASAGSGKTYSLTTEYLRTFFAGADADTILATTFTRTAAAEILGRVLRRMAEACESPKELAKLADDLEQPNLDAAKVREHLRRFCRSLDRVAIGTIDSFFSGIASCYKYESTMPLGGTISDEVSSSAKRLRMEAVRAVLAGQERTFVLSAIDQLQGRSAVRSIAGGLDQKLAHLLPLFASTDESCWDFPNLPPKLNDSELAVGISALNALEYPCTHKSYIKGMDGDRQKAARGDWAGFIGGGLAAKIAAGEPAYYGKEIPDDIAVVYHPLISHAHAVVLGDLADKTKAMYRLLAVLSAEYNKLRIAQRMAFFSDVPLALSQLMAQLKFDDVAYRLDRNINHVMLDEFQDTDPRQWRILDPFAGRVRDSDAGGGSVFWVGDVKQAIYGWRGARAAILAGLNSAYPNLHWKSLNKSYRSSQVVLDAVNHVFMALENSSVISDDLRPAVESWCAGYEKHEAEFDLPGYVSVLESPPIGSDAVADADDASDDIESSQAGDLTHVLFAAARVKDIYDQAPGRSVGVLTRTNAMADSVLFQLRRMGVPATALAGSPLLSDPAAALVLAALSLADRPVDKYAAFRVLNSPLAPVVGLQHLEVWHLKDVALAIRHSLADNGYAETLVAWAHVLAPSCDARGASRLAYLVELADQFDQEPGMRPRDFVDLARDSSCMDPTPAPVHVMSIHKAKGLEFDCVVLPELHKKLFSPTPTVLTETDPNTHEVIGVTSYANKGILALDSRLSRMYDQYRRDEMRESLCLLYVALTRARYGLTIVAPGIAEGARQPPFSLLSIVKDRLCTGETVDLPTGGRRLYELGDSQWFKKLPPIAAQQPQADADAVMVTTSIPAVGHRIRRRQAPSSVAGWGKVYAEQLLAPDSREGMLTGSIIHSMFQQIEWIEDGAPDDATLVRATKRASPTASEGRIQREAAEFRTMLSKSGVRSALTRPVLQQGETMELWRERAFATFIDGSYIGGIFDRVVVVSRGGRPIAAHLLDYKTGDVTISTPEQEAAKYATQMAMYRAALCGMLLLAPEAVSVTVLFPSTGDTVAI